jgi:mannosyltransferase OCH1-like enzyme
MKRIIQYWDGNIPADVKVLTETWREMNPDFDYILYDYNQALRFIKENFPESIFNSFKKLTIPAMICDVFRVAIILKLGGIYVDCGTKCYKSIAELNLDPSKCTFLRKSNGWVCNGWICADIENPVMKAIWDRISDVLLNETEGNIWALTGPKVFMQIVNEFSESELKYIKTEVGNPLNSTSINILEQKSSSSVFSIINKLKHKSSNHWSDLQKIMPLFEINNRTSIVNQSINKHLIIHIGQHKTGSTAIQQSLNKLDANNAKVMFPKTGLSFSGHHKISDIFQGKEDDISNFFKNFFEEISKNDADIVVLSSEYFSSGNEISFNKKRMNTIWTHLSWLTTHFFSSEIVYYVRPQVNSIESRINQSIKSRLCLDNLNIPKFLNNPTINYNIFDEAIRNFFTNSKITPRVFQRSSLIGNDVVLDFNTIIPEVKLPLTPSANNRIENKDEVLSCLEINKMNLSVDEKMKKKHSVRAMNKCTKENFSLLTDEQKSTINEYYEKSNTSFFDKYSYLNKF